MYYPRRENPLEALLRWRRNVFLQLPGGGYVLVSATRYMVALHHFDGSLRADPARTERLDQFPASLFDGQGWNLALLTNLIQPEQIMTDNQQPFTALYCKPFREAIPKLNNIELRAFTYLATYTDSRGICDPGVRELSNSGLSTTEVSEALAGLVRKGIVYFLRYNQRDPITGRMMSNVMGANPEILRIKSDSGIQTYMHEFLNQVSPSTSAQPESPESNTNNYIQELTPITTTTNHHQKAFQDVAPDGAGKDPGMEKARDYANQIGDSRSDAPKANPETPDRATPAAQPQQRAAQPEPSPGSALPPPPDTGALTAYAVPLPDSDRETLANELHSSLAGMQIAKARQLVECYEPAHIRTALALYGRQPSGAVENPAGWLIAKLRGRALVPAVDGAQRRGKYSDFIES